MLTLDIPRVLIRIEDLGGTNWGVRITGNQGESYALGGPMDLQLGSVEILLGGDTEAETIAEALDLLLRQFGRLLATRRSIGPRCLTIGTKKGDPTNTRQAI